MKSLKDVKVGETATVVKLHGEGATMELNVRGYELSVRKADAEKIEVS